MRIIAQRNLAGFAARHADAEVSLTHWLTVTKAARWLTTSDVQQWFPKAKVLNGERVRFEVSGGKYRLIVAFDFESQLCFVKFIGTHAEYDRVDALTISMF
jgi:mRNA interferase HigB